LPYPPRQGTTIRNYNLIAQLAQRHTVDLLTFLAPSEQLDATNVLHTLCRRVEAIQQPTRSIKARALDTLRSPLPDMALRLEDAIMHQRVRTWLTERQYDVVQIEGIEMAQYGTHALATGAKLIFDDHNCEYLLQQRAAFTDLRQPRRWVAALYSLMQWAKLRRYERQICQRVHAVVAVSEADRIALLDITPSSSITVVPNGIDLAAYPDAAIDNATIDDATLPSLPHKLVFTGKMDYRPNIDAVLWFGQQVLPRIQAQIPDVLFQIVGMNPHRRLDILRDNPAIEITGAVDDTQPYIREAAIYVIPMRVGGGTRFKVLEAMACSKAIVSTSLGAEGFAVQDGNELLLADGPEAFGNAIIRLLTDRLHDSQMAYKSGIQARRFVENGYTWPQIIPRLENIYSS